MKLIHVFIFLSVTIFPPICISQDSNKEIARRMAEEQFAKHLMNCNGKDYAIFNSAVEKDDIDVAEIRTYVHKKNNFTYVLFEPKVSSVEQLNGIEYLAGATFFGVNFVRYVFHAAVDDSLKRRKNSDEESCRASPWEDAREGVIPRELSVIKKNGTWGVVQSEIREQITCKTIAHCLTDSTKSNDAPQQIEQKATAFRSR